MLMLQNLCGILELKITSPGSLRRTMNQNGKIDSLAVWNEYIGLLWHIHWTSETSNMSRKLTIKVNSFNFKVNQISNFGS